MTNLYSLRAPVKLNPNDQILNFISNIWKSYLEFIAWSSKPHINDMEFVDLTFGHCERIKYRSMVYGLTKWIHIIIFTSESIVNSKQHLNTRLFLLINQLFDNSLLVKCRKGSLESFSIYRNYFIFYFWLYFTFIAISRGRSHKSLRHVLKTF